MAVGPNNTGVLAIPALPALPALALHPLPTPKGPGTATPQYEYQCTFICPDGSCGDSGVCGDGGGGGCTLICPDGSCGDYGGCNPFQTGVPYPHSPSSGGGSQTGGGGSGGGSSGSSSGSSGGCTSIWSAFANPLQCFLRLLFFLLGLICIAGAIYLFKPTSEIIAAPIRAAKGAARAAAEGAAAAE